MTFNDLKKNAGKNLENLVQELDKMKGTSYNDDRFWSCALNEKTRNGSAIIRFLPEAPNNTLPWVKYYSHSFQGPGGWYIEKSLSTLGKPDPVGEANTELWNTNIEANKEIVRKRKRKTNFVSNILVINDPKNPENEGKVFLFRYGTKIFDKIQAKMKPDFDDVEPVDIFNFWSGANFRLRIVQKDGYANYDESTFDAPSALFDGDDEKLEKIWKSQYDLREFVDPKNYKSYEDLKARFDKVMGNKAAKATPEAKIPTITEADVDDSAPWEEADEMKAFVARTSGKTKKATATPKTVVTDDDDDSMEELRRLAEEED